MALCARNTEDDGLLMICQSGSYLEPEVGWPALQDEVTHSFEGAVKSVKEKHDADELIAVARRFNVVMGDGGTVNIGSSRAVAIECAKS